MYLGSPRLKQRPSPWPRILFIIVVAVAAYLGLTRQSEIRGAFVTPVPTVLPTRSAVSYLVEADDAYTSGDLLKALSAYQQASQLDPTNDQSFALQAKIQVLRGHQPESVDLARQAVALAPKRSRNYGVLAMALDWAGKLDEALQNAQKGVELDPKSAEANAYLAEVWADKNNWDRALKSGQTAVSLDEKSIDANRDMGYVYERQGKHSLAIQSYQKAIDLNPHLAYIYIGLARNYLALDQQAKAFEVYQKGMDMAPHSPEVYDAYGWALFNNGDPDRGEELINKALEIDPEYWQALVHQAQSDYHLLHYEDAIPKFETAVSKGFSNAEVLYQLGLSYIYAEPRDCAKAIPWLQKALVADPGNQPAKAGLNTCGVK